MGMGQKISEHKVKRILELHLAGDTQPQIASVLKINQSTVSLTIGKFKSLVTQYGLEVAAKEYGIMDQIESLHGLAVELKAAGISVEEAEAGAKMVKLFKEYEVKPGNYGDLIHACTKMKSDGSLPYAVKLAHLENTTGKTSEQLVNHFEDIIQQLPAQEKKLQILKSKVSATEADLASLENKKKAASQDLEAHMQKVGVDSNRLKLVEDLALALKEGGISNEAIQDYIQRQQLLNEAGIGVGIFVSILDKAKTATSQDQGKELLQLLSDYGSLAEVNKALHSQVQSLQKEVQGLEKKSEMKQKLEGDIAELKGEKTILEGELAKLYGQKDALHKIKSQVTTLIEKKTALSEDITRLGKYNLSLTDEIKLKEDRVSDLEELELKSESLSTYLTDIEAKINHEGKRWAIFESFLGLVGTGSMPDMEKFAKVLPHLLTEVRQGKYSPQLLLDHMLENLNGHALQVLKCTGCATRFIVDQPPKLGGCYCPSCGSSYQVHVEQGALETLGKALGMPQGYSITLVKEPKNKDMASG